MKKQLSTQPYKGSRDFYPEDMRLQQYIFDTWDRVCKSFGYEKYDFPFLEDYEIYLAKSGEEIADKQTYVFEDRGGRKVAIRPEATPSVARLVAQKLEELPRPIRWYSYPNLWRYEKPQRGRLREHYQLNADMFGPANAVADAEAIALAIEILKAFGADEDHFIVYINDRRLTNYFLKNYLELNDDLAKKVSKAIDRMDKMYPDQFEQMVLDSGLDKNKLDKLYKVLETRTFSASEFDGVAEVKEIEKLFEILAAGGYAKNCEYNPKIMRGFDYYTGTVFEVYDRSPENQRSLFGGGRYDDLLTIFDKPKMPAVGFGMGDVTLKDFLTVHNLLPDLRIETKVLVSVFDESSLFDALGVSTKLRKFGINCEVYPEIAKLDKQLKYADKKRIPYVLIQGPDEKEKNVFVLKDMVDKKQEVIAFEGVLKKLKR